jgi:hypothetical protein
MVDSVKITQLMGFDHMHKVGKLLILNNKKKNEEVVVNYIAITEHTSLWEISGGFKYGNLQNADKSACIHPNYWSKQH